jgi:hypothetical protein
MKFLSQLTSMVSGSVNGLTGSHNKGGQYFRARVVPTNPNTQFQAFSRNALGILADYWTNVLTPTERLSWETYAQNVSWTDRLGQTIQLSGINHFIRSNAPRVLSTQMAGGGHFADFTALAVISTAPTVYDLGNKIVFSGVPGVTPEVADFGWTETMASGNVMAWLSPPLNPSINFWRGPYIAIGVMAAGMGGQINLDATNDSYFVRYGALTPGQRVFGYVRRLYTDGRLTGRTYFGPVTVSPP